MTQYVLVATEWLNFSGLFAWFKELRTNYKHTKEVSNTIKELSALSDSELRDIGLSRGDIWSVAHEAHFDNQTPSNNNLKGWV